MWLRMMIWKREQLSNIVLVEGGGCQPWTRSRPASTKHLRARYSHGLKERERRDYGKWRIQALSERNTGSPPQTVKASSA